MQNTAAYDDAIKLRLHFDPIALQQDLDRIADDRWIEHFVKDNYEGDWSGVARACQCYPSDPAIIRRSRDRSLG